LGKNGSAYGNIPVDGVERPDTTCIKKEHPTPIPNPQ
jgi:hypothetical protein